MRWRAVRAIIWKDLRVVVQSKAVLLPLILVPVLLLVLMPALVALVPVDTSMPVSGLTSLAVFLANLPPELQAELVGLDERQTWVTLALVYFLAPMYLIIPLMVASVIAADSFAGERERKTLEALLYSPTDDRELFLAKVLAAWLPAVGVALGGFVLYGLVANLAAWPVMGRLFFPTPMWLVLVFWVAPPAAGLGLGSMVLVSSRVHSFQEGARAAVGGRAWG